MALQCRLCPKECRLEPGESGDCRIRINRNNILTTVTYGHPCAIHIDPIEKKPLFHFLPGSNILSIATVGCNLHCKHCQNWEISQENPEDTDTEKVLPADICQLTLKNGCPSIAYTYTEPLVYYEYTYDCCVAAKEAGLRNVLVTAGYLNKGPLKRLYAQGDAANVDIKSMSDKFYADICDASLRPVLDGLLVAKDAGVHLEITYLIIPTLNDQKENFTKLSQWMIANLGAETPLHYSRFFPRYQLRNLPPTPVETLQQAREIAQSAGLKHVYVGNVETRDGENTYCPHCNQLLIQRSGYTILQNQIKDGNCPACHTKVYGQWT